MQSNRTFPRKVDRERITIGSFLAHRFGLRIFVRGDFSKRVRKLLATTFFILGILMKFDVSGSRIMNLGSEGVYLHEKCGTNPSRPLPGPKTTIKNQKCRETAKSLKSIQPQAACEKAKSEQFICHGEYFLYMFDC